MWFDGLGFGEVRSGWVWLQVRLARVRDLFGGIEIRLGLAEVTVTGQGTGVYGGATWRFIVTVLITILGHLRGLYVGYKYSHNWLICTMNLQAGFGVYGSGCWARLKLGAGDLQVRSPRSRSN